MVRFKATGGGKAKSSIKKKNLNPTWEETFTLPADDPDGFLEIVVEDYDLASGNDFMGGGG